MFDRYAKAIVGGLVAFGSALVPALADGAISNEELSVLVAAVLGGTGFVWAVPKAWLLNTAKAVAGAVSAGGAAFLAVYADGAIGGSDLWYILAAVVGALSVYQVPNAE